jgi:dipeptidyl aminopeptidase/acylaminoacyl peptidase
VAQLVETRVRVLLVCVISLLPAVSTVIHTPLTVHSIHSIRHSLSYQVRGSSGYGKKYMALDDQYLREDSVRDIGALLEWIKARHELDESRVFVSGGSYGGYMTLASVVHYGARFRCALETVGISNFVTFLENTKGYRRNLR